MSAVVRMLRLPAVALILAATAALALSHSHTGVSAAASGWTTYHNDGSRSGFDANEPAWTATAPLAQWTSAGLDGSVYAEPLVLGGRVYVATENNTVYALGETTGATLWARNFGPPATGGWGCGNISPQGITGTPVIDPATGILYAVGTSPDLRYHLYAVNVADGTPAAAGRDITPAGMDVTVQGQRAAATLANGQVYVPFGGRDGDCGQYHPYLVAVPESGAPFKTFQPQTASQREAGMWGPSGGAADGAGFVYVATGNGGESDCAAPWDFGNAVLKLDANLNLVDSWRPASWCALSASDTDVGSLGPALLQNGLIFQAGKSGDGWLINSGAMGQNGGEVFSAHLGTCPTADAVFGGTAYSAPYLFVPCQGTGAGLIGLNVSGNSFSLMWQGGPSNPGPPIIAGGLVWTMTTGGGNLYGFDPVTGAQRVHVILSGGSTNHFPTPTADSGWIFTPQATTVHGFKFTGSAPTPTPSPTFSPPPAAGYVPLPPARILDTRDGTGGFSLPLGTQQSIDVQVTGRGGVPAGATAVVVNVTATNPTAAGYLTLFPSGSSRPAISNLNFGPGQTVPNLVQVPLSSGGQVAVFNWTGSTDVVMDVEGYFGGVGSSRFTPHAPARLLDTRQTQQTLGSGGTLDLQVSGSTVPAAATAVVLNVTVTGTGADSYLTVYPTGGAQPNASNLNWSAGQTVANRVIVKLGTAGKVRLQNLLGPVDVVVDLNGWYAASGSLFTGLNPARILDTRSGTGISGPLGPDQTALLQVTGQGGVPAGATAVVLNLTATGPTSPSFVTAYPSGPAARPVASDLNFGPGQTVPNLVIVQLGPDGRIALYNLAGSVDLIGDVFGWYG